MGYHLHMPFYLGVFTEYSCFVYFSSSKSERKRFLKVISFCFEDSSSSIKYAPLVEFNPLNLSITK